MEADSDKKDNDLSLLVTKVDAIISSLRFLDSKVDKIENCLKKRDGTIDQFYKKRIEIAIDELYDYVKTNMQTALFICVPRLLLKEKVLQQVSLDGAYLEFGVYKGESLAYMAKAVFPEVVCGFGSFDGLPEDWGGKACWFFSNA